MKIGTENKKKTAIAAGLMVVALFLVYRWVAGGNDDTAAAPPPTSTSSSAAATAPPTGTPGSGTKPASAKAEKNGTLLAQTLDPTLRFDLLKSSEDVSYKGSGRDIFSPQAPPPPIPKPLPQDVQPSTPPPPPPPPPSGLTFYGFAGRKDGYKRIFLAKGDDIFVAKEGDIVNRRYKIVKVNNNSVDIEDVLTNNKETLPLRAS